MKKVIRCFNCEKQISRKAGDQTVEHIPIQSLFEGFGDDYKLNRITVPCCYKCNNESSKVLDEEFRNFIGSISNHSDMQPIANKTIKSVLHYKKQFDRIHIDENRKFGIIFKKNLIAEYLKKVFKGVFYYQYKYPLPSQYTLGVDLDGDKIGKLSAQCMNYLLLNFEYKHSGSPYIFKYILQPLREGIRQKEKNDLIPEDTDRYVALFVFSNLTFSAMVYASLIKNTN